MRTLLIGSGGQLGRALATLFRRTHEVTQAVRRNPERDQLLLDLADPDSVRAAFRLARPELILIAGAFCNVDLCETEQDACRRVNVIGPKLLGELAREHGSLVVYYSTDHVFDGTAQSNREADPIRPLNLYARSKAEGEAALRDVLPDRHLILRTSWVYGPDRQRRNFALRLVDRLGRGEAVVVPADQWGSPTYTEDLACVTLFLVERGLTGTFHAVGPDFLDRPTLAGRICERFGLDAGKVLPKPTRELGQAAPRPLRVRLDCEKLQASGAPAFRDLEAGLRGLHGWARAEQEDRTAVPAKG